MKQSKIRAFLSAFIPFSFLMFFTNLIFTAATAAKLLEFNEIKPGLFLPAFSEN
jgi:hypothetical protein